jgi:cell division protein FtsI/penicillin-binding protein 2
MPTILALIGFDGSMRKAVVLGGAAVLVVAAGTTGFLVWRQAVAQDRAATAVIRQFAAAWQARDVGTVPFTQPDAAASFTPAVQGLLARAVVVQPGPVRRDGESAGADLSVTWTLPGEVTWTYTVPVRAAATDSRWAIARPASGTYWHPDLAPGETLTTKRSPATRGDLLDRFGTPLMPLGTVYPVQLDPTRADAAVAARLEKLVEATPGSLVATLAAAKKAGTKAPIPVITYREDDFAQRRAALDALTGVIYPRTVQPLASSREFGQPLLGSYGEVTAEIVKASAGRYLAGDRAGVSGLQHAHDRTLAGTPGLTVTSSKGTVLFEQAPTPGTDVSLTLDPRIQRAAESALAATGEVPSALVAIDVPTGQVLASANHPWFGFDRALTGRYPPGSTFKVASTYALLSGGKVDLTDPVSCPQAFTVNGKGFRNFEGETLGSPTFADDVVHSCNTAFVQLAERLGDGDLTEAAKTLGIGAGWAATLGVAGAVDGSVPPATGPVDKAAATIGQGRVIVSPMALAVMSASVARGAYLPPALVTAAEPVGQGTAAAPTPLDAKAVADLRTLLRQVVTKGTGTALAAAPGRPVSGKTGTAEFGNDSPPKTHAWFTGYAGDVAFAVLVERGRSGGSVAAPVAKQFLADLAQG